MLKLLKQMNGREIGMALFCAFFLLGQVYFDLKLPDYITDLTVLIQTHAELIKIWHTGLEMMICVLASAMLYVVCAYLSSRVAAGFSFGLRDKLFKKIVSFGQAEYAHFSVPSLITRTTNDVTQIQMIIAMGLQIIVKSPIMAVWAIAKILDKSWQLSAVTAGFVVVIIVFVVMVALTIIPRLRIIQRLTDKINLITRENLEGISVVHAFNAQDYQNRKFGQVNDSMYELQLKNQRLFTAMQPFMNFVMNLLALSIFWVGSVLLSEIAPEQFAARLDMFSNIIVFSTYATYVAVSFMSMALVFTMVPAGQVSAERINAVLDKDLSIIEGHHAYNGEGTAPENTHRGEIIFDHVSFQYPDAQEEDLTDISFTLKQGETLAIIGATGSGKTTLMHLITRFYDATTGRITIDDRDIKDYTFDNLYGKFGFVTQKAVLFTGTIAHNISFGKDGDTIPEERITKALDIAQASDFVAETTGGLNHEINRGGKNVSGGQKQRLAIARALAKEPEFLLFDDSFSALDYRTDATLRGRLHAELADVTKVIVAQRISTVSEADHILVLDGGHMVGYGTHFELLQSCEVYQEIALSQLSEEELQEMGVSVCDM